MLDPYTLLFAVPATFSILPHIRKVTYGFESFDMMGGIGNTSSIIAARNDFPVKTLAELIEFAKSKPDALTRSSAGVGSLGHVAGEVFLRQAGISALHVPFKRSNDCVIGVVGGQVDFAVNNATLLQIKGGRVKGLAVLSDKAMPNSSVPSLPETGVTIRMSAAPFGVMAPHGTPKEVIMKLGKVTARGRAGAGSRGSLRAPGAIIAARLRAGACHPS